MEKGWCGEGGNSIFIITESSGHLNLYSWSEIRLHTKNQRPSLPESVFVWWGCLCHCYMVKTMLTRCILTRLRVFEELFNTNVAACIVLKKYLIIVFSSFFASVCYFHRIMPQQKSFCIISFFSRVNRLTSYFIYSVIWNISEKQWTSNPVI